MLDIVFEIKNDKVVAQQLRQLNLDITKAVQRGLTNAGRGTFQQAFQWLSGSASGPPGAYPVPIRTGHLRRNLNFLDPGQSKSGPAGTFTAGPLEAVVFDSAEYAADVFSGAGSSAGHGERDALRDGLDLFDRTKGARFTIDLEIRKELNRG